MNRKYRKTIIAGNWKMNRLPSEIKGYAEELKAIIPRAKWCEVALCVPFVMLYAGQKALKDTRFAIGAQDVSAYDSGAYTGEVSAAQLADAGCKYVIIGHSERRQYHGDTDFMVREKLRKVLEQKLIPIVCVGESLEQRELGVTIEHITYQVRTVLSGLAGEKVRKIVFAYEPIWAIGTGRTATPEDAGAVCGAIRAVIRGLYGARVARAVTIQYGGSMNAGNAADLLAQPDIDGGLIGGASLKPEEFARIILASNVEE